MKHRAYDLLGNVAIVNFSEDSKIVDKRKFADKILNENRSISTVLEKTGKVSGRLRKPTTKYLAGAKTKEVLYRENNCVFRFNVDTTYFSPRLSGERKELAGLVKKGEEVLVMFAGVGPLPIVIAKNSGVRRVYHNELNREANKYAKLNVEKNKLKDKIEFVNGDVKKVAEKLSKQGKKFDVIFMPRPQLKDTFLKDALKVSKKGTRVYYFDFCKVDEVNEIVEKIKIEVAQAKKKIKILETKKAGEIAPYKIRLRVDFVVL